MLVVGGLVVALNVVNYTLLSYMPTYLQRRIGLTTDEALVVPIIGMVFMMVTAMISVETAVDDIARPSAMITRIAMR